MFNYKDLVFGDFSGGITDKYLDNPSNEAKTLDNFVISPKGRPAIRPGFDNYVEYNVYSKSKINGLVNFKDKLIMFRNDGGKNARVINDDDLTAQPEIVITPNNSMFDVIAQDSMLSFAEWSNNLLVTNRGDDDFGSVPSAQYNRPMSIYKDTADIYRAHKLGLPPFEVTLTEFNEDSGTNAYTYLVYYTMEYDVKISNELGVESVVKQRYVGEAAQFEVTNAAEIGVGSNNVEYKIDNISPANLNAENYDASSMKISIFRTIANASAPQVFYLAAEYDVGDPAYTGQLTIDETDSLKDEDLIANQQSYRSGGVVNFSRPPKCKYLTVVNNTAYFASCVDDNEDTYQPKRFYQSIPGVASAVFNSGFEEVEDNITGIGQVNGFPVVFTESVIYRVEGGYDSLGLGSIRLRVISDTIGCVSHNSIVNAGKQLYFAGHNGFYVTDGYNIKLLTPRLHESYSDVVANGVGYHAWGVYDRDNERIYWGASENNTPELEVGNIRPTSEQLRAVNNNIMWVYNLKSAGFTKIKQNKMSVCSLAERFGILYRGDKNGFILSHSDKISDDVLADVNTVPALWKKIHIPFKLVTYATDFGIPAVKKWVNSASVTLQGRGRYAYKPISINDDSYKEAPMKPVRQMNTAAWRDTDFLWADNDIIWRVKNTVAKQRRFPRKHMRCWRKQIGIEPVEVVLFTSSTFNKADISSIGSSNTYTATINAGQWPSDLVGRRIALELDGYDREFLITSRDNDTVIKFTGTGGLAGVALDWHIVGFNKEQRFEVQSISLKYALLSREGDKYQSEEASGE